MGERDKPSRYRAPMRIGAQVRAGQASFLRSSAVQPWALRSSRSSPDVEADQYGPEVHDAFQAVLLDHPSVTATFCHAAHLINLATPDPELVGTSRAWLAATRPPPPG